MAPNEFYSEWDNERVQQQPREHANVDTDTVRRDGEEHRSRFQVDRDRVLFSYAFRRLQSKTQVFQSGEFDFYRTRLTHTIEVARIARSIADYLRSTDSHLRNDFFVDPDLVEAVGLAHDLGHPPFGHIGERKLNELMAQHGGFEGNAQTVRLLTDTLWERESEPRGMNPTRAFLDGVLKYKALRTELEHATGKIPDNHFLYDDQSWIRESIAGGNASTVPCAFWREREAHKSIECQIMDWADDTAYSLHDITDGVHAGYVTVQAVTAWSRQVSNLTDHQAEYLQEILKLIPDRYKLEMVLARRIGACIRACHLVEENSSPLAALTNRHRYRLVVDPKVEEETALLKKMANDLIFQSTPIQQIEFKSGQLLERLFGALFEHYVGGAKRPLKIIPQPAAGWIAKESAPNAKARLLCDYISGLTDSNALRLYKRLFSPDFGSIIDLS